MYEEKPKKSLNFKNLNVNWKSLTIKFAILLVAVFIILFLVSLVKKDKKVLESNLSTNLQSMKVAANEYFTGSRLPSNINGRKKITLGEMFENKLLVEFKDQNNNSCDTIGSFAEATKINSTDYTIKVKLVCGSESDYVIDTIKFEDNNANTPDINNGDNSENNTNNSNQTNNTNTNTNTNVNTNTTKPSNKPNSNTSSTNKNPITNVTTKPNTNNNSSSNSNNTIATTCTYGSKDYTSTYPLAYVIPGNCAVSKSDYYKAEYANKVSSISAAEYKKLSNEMITLKNKVAGNLYLENPSYFGVYNKSNNGLVGYQILFTMKQKVNYVTTTVYQYYLNENGTRTVVVDKRNNIATSTGNNNNNNSSKPSTSTIRVTSVSLNRTSLDLDVNDTYNLVVTINPNNATNKKVSWSSSNSNVATVNSYGKVTALREGTATITATVDGKSATTRVYVYKEQTTRYCNTNKERVYSTGYISQNELKNKGNYSYQVVLNTKNTNIYDIEYGNLTTGNEYAAAYSYWKNKNKPLSLVGGTGTGSIDAGSYSNLITHSLKSYNFIPTVSYVKKSGNDLYFNIYINLRNLNYIEYATPYYTNGLGVYFVPLYFDIITINYNDCKYITNSQVIYYTNNGYVRAN